MAFIKIGRSRKAGEHIPWVTPSLYPAYDQGSSPMLRYPALLTHARKTVAIKLAVVIVILLAGLLSTAAAELRPCFTPEEDCTSVIVDAIDGARSELLVQAYGFTSVPIMQAVVRAKERGVTVKVILDKINEQKRYTAATFLKNHGIEPLIDDRVAIAHNKVMVIDRRNTITGSFNFTTAAQRRNAENVLLILDDPKIAEAYAQNWQRRAEQSKPYNDFRQRTGSRSPSEH